MEVFRTEIESAIQFYYCYLAFNEEIAKSKEKLEFINKTPLFWKTNIGALQISFFITLGRVFDRTSKHNIYNLLKTSKKHKEIFSKSALEARKKAGSSNAHEWIEDYMLSVYEPKAADFDRLERNVIKYSNIYEQNYKKIRNKIFAHKELSKSSETEKLFKKANNQEISEILIFLKKLYNALWELYTNGREPKLKPLPYSFKKLMKEAKKNPKTGELQQRIIGETVTFFKSIK